MMHNPVMFVVEIGFVIALLLSIFPELFGPTDGINNVRLYNIFVCVILFVTVLFANFAEAIAEARGRAQADSLRKTREETPAKRIEPDGRRPRRTPRPVCSRPTAPRPSSPPAS